MGKIFVSLLQISLNGGGASQSTSHSAEIGKHRIAGVMNDLALMLFDGDADEVKVLAEPTMGSFLILAGQPAVSSYIRVQDGRKLSRQSVFHLEVPFVESGRSVE